jgi:hypothetical protein
MMARLCDIESAAEYLSVGVSFVRSLVRRGDLVPVRLPSVRGGGSSRRLVFDVEDLDRLIEQWKSTSHAYAPNAQLSAAALKGWRSTPVRNTRRRNDGKDV